MGVNEKDKQNLDRWHRNQGATQPPKDRRGAQEGHLNSLKHGIFADRCLTPEEKQLFDVIIERLHQDFQFNKSSDFIQVELVGVYSVKLVRAQMEGNTQAQDTASLGNSIDTFGIIWGDVSPELEGHFQFCSWIFYLGTVQMLK